MRQNVLAFVAAGLVLPGAVTASADNELRVTPDDPLVVEFRVDPGSTITPDTFLVYLGQAEASEPGTCLLVGQLANDGVGIAVQGYRAPFCDIFGPIDLDPGSAFADRGTPYTLLDPGHPDVGALRVMAQGTESGLFALVLFSGELIIHADDVRIEWGEGTGPDTYTLSDVQPEITSVYVGQPCYADLDRSGELDVFDFLDFQNAFAAGSLRADCDVDGSLDFFDFLCFLDAFDAGCADR